MLTVMKKDDYVWHVMRKVQEYAYKPISEYTLHSAASLLEYWRTTVGDDWINAHIAYDSNDRVIDACFYYNDRSILLSLGESTFDIFLGNSTPSVRSDIITDTPYREVSENFIKRHWNWLRKENN